jgi:hypothetical protein
VLAEALRAGGPLVRTGGDGWHFYFAPTGAPSQLPWGLPGMEWQGLGGLVVAPPSRHPGGALAVWVRGLDAPLPRAPMAILERLELGAPPDAGAAEAPPAPPPHAHRAVASGEQVPFFIPLSRRE